MSEVTTSRTVTVINREGLHARPAYMFVEVAGRFTSRIEVVKNGERVDGKSILSILTLGAEQGTQLVLEATGSDAEAALSALNELFEQGFPQKEAAETTHQTDN